MHAGGHRPQCMASGPKSPPAASGRPPSRRGRAATSSPAPNPPAVPPAAPGRGRGPAPPRSTGQGGGHMVEACAVERLKKVDGGLRALPAPTGTPQDRRDRRSPAPWPARRRAPTPPAPDAAPCPATVASSSGASWASRNASVHTARPSSSSRARAPTPHPPARNAARRRHAGARGPGGPACRSPRPPDRAGPAGRGGSPRPGGRRCPLSGCGCRSSTGRCGARPQPRCAKACSRSGVIPSTPVSSSTRSNHRNP